MLNLQSRIQNRDSKKQISPKFCVLSTFLPYSNDVVETSLDRWFWFPKNIINRNKFHKTKKN
jgi:hypothetical protein